MVGDLAEDEIEKLKDREFIRQWDHFDDVPACSVGVRLLRQFAEAHPGPYELALQKGLYDLTPPVFARLPKWQAFLQHRSCCGDCNEA